MKHPEGKNKDRRSKMPRRTVLIAVAVLVLVIGVGAYALIPTGTEQQEVAVNQPPPEPKPATEPPPPKGWKPIPIETPRPPERMIEVTIDEIYRARRDHADPWVRIKTAKSLRVTGKLIAFEYRGMSGVLTLEGETPGNILYVHGRAKDSSTDLPLWKTCPKSQDWRLVKRQFRERVKLGDVLMVEGTLYRNNQLISDITRVYVRK